MKVNCSVCNARVYEDLCASRGTLCSIGEQWCAQHRTSAEKAKCAMRSSRYDLHMKVPSNTVPFRVVRRRVIDGGFECNCPRWVEQRKECRHVKDLKPLLARGPRIESPVDRAIQSAINTFPHYINAESLLVERLKRAVREAIGGTD